MTICPVHDYLEEGIYSYVGEFQPQYYEDGCFIEVYSIPIKIIFTVGTHEHVWSETYHYNATHHWRYCSVDGCTERLEEEHVKTVVNKKESTFDKDGYSGDIVCSVCGYQYEKGHEIAAGKYIRESSATMSPESIAADMCANDIVFKSGDTKKYTVSLSRVLDNTNPSLNTDEGRYPKDKNFVEGHEYLIEVDFEKVSPYVYEQSSSYYWSTFTINGKTTKMPNWSTVSGCTTRLLVLVAGKATVKPTPSPGPSIDPTPSPEPSTEVKPSPSSEVQPESKPSEAKADATSKKVEETAPVTEVTVNNATYKVNGETAVLDNAKAATGSFSVLPTVQIGDKQYAVSKIAAGAFKGSKITSLKIGKGITEIGNSAFEGCASLKSVTIGADVTKIGKKAFYNCKKLKSVTVKSKKLKSVGSNAFKKIKKNATIKVPKNKLANYKKLLKKKIESSAKVKK